MISYFSCVLKSFASLPSKYPSYCGFDTQPLPNNASSIFFLYVRLSFCIILTLSSISNDFSYLNIFSRQLEALADDRDIVIGISTSGKSKNVINALKVAKTQNCITIGFSGGDGGQMNEFCDVNLKVPSYNTPRIQEMHIIFGHTICQLIDKAFQTSI